MTSAIMLLLRIPQRPLGVGSFLLFSLKKVVPTDFSVQD